MIEGGVCKTCHMSCVTCYKSSSNGCSSCKPGFSLNKITTTCIPNCDSKNGKFLDAVANVCSDCSEGCLECLDASHCTRCNPNTNYYLKRDNKCHTCPVGNKKFMDKVLSNPPTCLDCIEHCLTCSDQNSCSTCETGYLYDGAGKCILCDTTTGTLVLVTEITPHVCMECHSTCKDLTI